MSVTSPDHSTDQSAEDVSTAKLASLTAEIPETTRAEAAVEPAPDTGEEPDVEMVAAPSSFVSDEASDGAEIASPEASQAGAERDNQSAQLSGQHALPQQTTPKTRRPRTRAQRIARVLLLVVLAGMLIPTGMLIGFGVQAYGTYNDLKDQAHSGVQHLLNIKTVFTGIKTHPTGFLDVTKLHHAQQELAAAHSDFQQIQSKLAHSDIVRTITGYFPQYLVQVRSASAASQIGIDVTTMGQELIHTALILAPSFRGSILTNSSKPLITQDMLNLVGTTISDLLPGLTDIQNQARMLSLDSLPVSADQRAQFAQLVQAIPQAESDLIQVQDLLGSANWLLGVDSPRTFLVQTMDRAEMRGTGGFTGQYGELTINAGRLSPFTLKDISLVEYTDTSKTLGQLAPPQYSSWWPFANWGLRDSNVSADFPTSASMAVSLYKAEVGHQIDGVILFTPFLIEHVLQVIGPIQIPGYNETITAQNLEDRLHYYQQDNSGIAKQAAVQSGDNNTSYRKRFTELLARLLMDKVRHAPPDEIISIAREMLHDLKTKDLQVYFTNQQVEDLLAHYGYAAQIDRSTTHDGLYVVQENVSASKASQFVKTIMHDTVTLDASGGATHVLQLRLVYNQIGPVYGYDGYRDYVRVYVPPNSTFLWGDGFDTGTPLCGGTYVQCDPNGVYPGGELACPTGLYQPGAKAPAINDPDGGMWRPLDTIGPPPSMKSDIAGRAMFGGWVIVPKNCTMTATLSWYVPPMSQSYSLLVQRQAGMFPELDLTILPTPGDCAALKTGIFHVDSIMGEDMAFAPPRLQLAPHSRSSACYPQPGI